MCQRAEHCRPGRTILGLCVLYLSYLQYIKKKVIERIPKPDDFLHHPIFKKYFLQYAMLNLSHFTKNYKKLFLVKLHSTDCKH